MKASWLGWPTVGKVGFHIGKMLLLWVCDKSSLGGELTLTGDLPVRLACFADAV